jgi:putative glycosyltransferase (TIGR04372 family)
MRSNIPYSRIRFTSRFRTLLSGLRQATLSRAFSPIPTDKYAVPEKRHAAGSNDMDVSVSVGPDVCVPLGIHNQYVQAIVVEGLTGTIADHEGLLCALRTAEEQLRRVMEASPAWVAAGRALGRNLWFQGRFEEALQTFAAAEEMRDSMAQAAHLARDSCVFLPGNCAQSIGLMGHIDGFVKSKLLTRDTRPYYLIAPNGTAVNSVFLDYWRKYITVLSHPEEISQFAHLEPVFSANWNWVMPHHGKHVFVHQGIAAVQRAWQSENRPPLLSLRRPEARALARARSRWGMREQDRFVCLHVRSGGYYGRAHDRSQRFRNTSIECYYPMIRALIGKGFWVVRMGDASMPPLDPAQCGDPTRVIDYALSVDKSETLDVALCARCELFVSSSSGLHTIAHAFGRPACGVNHTIYAGFPWHTADIFIPQLYFSHRENRVLGLEEILGSDIPFRDHHFLLEQAGLSLIPNDADDIAETVLEALSGGGERAGNAGIAESVCAHFDELNRKYERGISGRLGRYFAMKHAASLLREAHQPELARMPFPMVPALGTRC